MVCWWVPAPENHRMCSYSLRNRILGSIRSHRGHWEQKEWLIYQSSNYLFSMNILKGCMLYKQNCKYYQEITIIILAPFCIDYFECEHTLLFFLPFPSEGALVCFSLKFEASQTHFASPFSSNFQLPEPFLFSCLSYLVHHFGKILCQCYEQNMRGCKICKSVHSNIWSKSHWAYMVFADNVVIETQFCQLFKLLKSDEPHLELSEIHKWVDKFFDAHVVLQTWK